MSARVAVREAGPAFLLVSLLWWLPAVIGRSAPLFHDLGDQHYPWRAWVARAWASGALPVWAPIGLGTPLLADGRAGVFYPPTLFVYGVFSEPVAFGLSLAFHQGFAALGAFTLARVQGRSPLAGVLAAGVWALGSALTGRLVVLPTFETLAWLPWVAVFAIRAASGEPRAAVLAGLALGTAALAGDPGTAVLLVVAAVFLAVWFGVEARTSRVLPAALVPSWAGLAVAAAVAGLIAVGIALPQGLATQELLSEVPLPWASGAARARDLLGVVLPSPFGLDRPADVSQVYGAFDAEGFGYVGPAALLLVALAGQVRRARPWWVLAIGSIGLAFVPIPTPLAPVAGGATLALPFAVLAPFAASQLAAIGLDRAASRVMAGQARGLGTGLGVVVLGGWLAIVALYLGGVGPAPWTGLVVSPFGIAALVAGVLRGAERGRMLPSIALRLVVLGILCDLGPRAWFLSSTSAVTDEVTRPPATVPSLGMAGGYRSAVLDRRGPVALSHALPGASRGLVWGLDDVAFPGVAPRAEVDAWNDAMGLGFARSGDEAVAAYRANRTLAQVAGVRWVYTRHALDDLPGMKLLWSAPVGDDVARVYEDEGAQPRAWFVGCARVAEDAIAELGAVDPTAEAIVAVGGTATCVPGVAGRVSLRGPAPGQIVAMEVDADRDGWLVIAESRWPGQRVVVDDHDVLATPTDGPFQGVALAAGHHEVQLAYAPMWLFVAARISSLVVVGVVMGLVLLRGRPGPAKAPPPRDVGQPAG